MELRGTGRTVKLYLTVYLCLWLTIANTVICGWSGRNSSSRVGGVKIGERDRGFGVKIGERQQKVNGTNRASLGVKIGDATKPKKTSAAETSRPGKGYEVDAKQERLLKAGAAAAVQELRIPGIQQGDRLGDDAAEARQHETEHVQDVRDRPEDRQPHDDAQSEEFDSPGGDTEMVCGGGCISNSILPCRPEVALNVKGCAKKSFPRQQRYKK
ncbi:UNVERIFIED_CONTAM: hypothetical protein PYX00_008159 [Menopon gallinae]|uniref:Secreted protein n=1 Tax=Menopon gallinae TaxID=328185 RepID=A0AAW2HMA0_9NEOP